jgi:TonB family protein
MRDEATQQVESIWSDAELGKSTQVRVVHWLHQERWTAFSLGLHALALLCMALMPPKSSALALDMLSEDARYARYLAAPVEIDPPSFLDQPKGEAGTDGAKAQGDEGAAGATDAPKQPKRMGSGKPKPAQQDVRAEARAAGILGVLPGASETLAAGLGLFDPTGLSADGAAALGALLNGQLGASTGYGGLGMRNTGRGGGGDVEGAIGVGKLGVGLGGDCTGASCRVGALGGMSRAAKVPRAMHGEGTEIRGALAKEAIRRTIQRHLNEVRFCYTEGLRSRPDLHGRVQVMFMISGSGSVQSASVADSDLRQPGVERCIAEAVRRWSFPAPEGGGYVSVRYPFVFEQIGQ